METTTAYWTTEGRIIEVSLDILREQRISDCYLFEGGLTTLETPNLESILN